MAKVKLPQWTDVYPQGTKTGNEEQKLFISLSRHPKYNWRSIAALSKETGLTPTRVEEILYKYFKKGMVFQNPRASSQWAYWENVPNMVPDKKDTLFESDKKDRIKKATF